MAVKVKRLARSESVHAYSGVIEVVTDVKFPFGHRAEHVSEAAHGVQHAAAESEGRERKIKMIRGRIVVPHH